MVLKLITSITATCLLIAASAQISSETMTLTKPSNIYVFDGVNYDKCSIKQLVVNHVEASSTLKPKTNAYNEFNLIDNDSKTAWADGEEGSGVGSVLYFKIDEGIPDVIEIMPGYGKSTETWVNNLHPVSVNISLLDSEKNEKEVIEDYSISFTYEEGNLPIASQYLDISNYHLHNMALTEFTYVKIEIMEVNDGAKYNDLCISIVNFYEADKILESLSAEDFIQQNK